MTVTDRTDASEQEFRDRVQPFEDAPELPESWEGSNALADHFESGFAEERVIEEVARAIYDSVIGQWTGDIRDVLAANMDPRPIAAAAVSAYRATQDGGAAEAVRRVEALCEEWSDPGLHAGIRNNADRLRAALAPQAGDGAR